MVFDLLTVDDREQERLTKIETLKKKLNYNPLCLPPCKEGDDYNLLKSLMAEQRHYRRKKYDIRLPGIAPYSIIRISHEFKSGIDGEIKRVGPYNTPLKDMIGGQNFGKDSFNCDNGDHVFILDERDNYKIFCTGYQRMLDQGVTCNWYPVVYIRTNNNVTNWVWIKLANGALIQVEPDYKLLLERGSILEYAKNIKPGRWLHGLDAGFMHQVVGVMHNPPIEMTGTVSYNIGTPNGFCNIFGYPSTGRDDVVTVEGDIQSYNDDVYNHIWEDYERIRN